MKTVAVSNAVLNAALRATAYTGPGVLYLALFNASDVELSGNGYARQVIAFAAAAGGSSASNIDALFPIATPAGYTVHRIAVMDALTSGAELYAGALSSDSVLAAGDRIVFPAGSVVVSEG